MSQVLWKNMPSLFVVIFGFCLKSPAFAGNFHESLQANTICSAESIPSKIVIFEVPDDDGFFKTNLGLCRAISIDEQGTSTLFPVAQCLDENNKQFTFFFGGWLNMLSVKLSESEEDEDLLCR